jgi:hypothetical protein
MAILWSFDLEAVAQRNLYIESLKNTESIWEVQALIAQFRGGVKVREWKDIPH